MLTQPSPFPGTNSHAPSKSTTDFTADEGELPGVLAALVVVSWGASTLGVSLVRSPRNFYIGGQLDPSGHACFQPPDASGSEGTPLVLHADGTPLLIVPARATGYVFSPSGEARSLEAAREGASSSLEVPGAHAVPLSLGMSARIELFGCVFHVSSVLCGKPVSRGSFSSERSGASYFAASLAVHAGLLGVMAFLTPSLGLADEEDLNRDRLYLMQQYLNGDAEREQEQKARNEAGANADLPGGAAGARAPAAEGAMGSPSSQPRELRFARKGQEGNREPEVSRLEAMRDAATFGMIGILRSSAEGWRGPTAPWGSDSALFSDTTDAQGRMWGDEVGEAFGAGSLGLSGVGEGSGGTGIGIGLGDRGIGTGLGQLNLDGIAKGTGRLGGTHVARGVRVRAAETQVSGRLPGEVIQRVVRQNFGRFRLCYAQGLARNPNLEGRIAARFVIARDGSVTAVSNGGSDLPDGGVTSCVLSAFYGLSFPQPENGIVTVVYPILLSPG